MYVCGCYLAFHKGSMFAVDSMILSQTIEEAVRMNKSLHSSFGYNIYEVESKETQGIKRDCGFNAGKKTSGYKVIKNVCRAYDHPSWNE